MDQYSAPRGLARQRSVTECVAELDRELGVRRRCYVKWLNEGKLSMRDAADRFECLQQSLELLKEMATNLGPMADEPIKPSPRVIELPSDEEMGFKPQPSVAV